MELATPLDAFVKSDIAFSARFDSTQITLGDVMALVRFLTVVMEAAQSEIAERTGQEFEILPVVTITQGSINVRIDIKPSQWTVNIRTTAREVFLAIALLLNPSSVIKPPDPPPPPVSSQCEETIRSEYRQTVEAWQYFGKGFAAEFEASCGPTKIRSKIDVPPKARR